MVIFSIAVKHLKCDLLLSSAAYLHYLTYISIGSNSEGAANGIVLSGSTLVVKMLLKQTTKAGVFCCD